MDAHNTTSVLKTCAFDGYCPWNAFPHCIETLFMNFWQITGPGPRLNINTDFPSMEIAIIKIRRRDRLISITGISILPRHRFYFEKPAWSSVLRYAVSTSHPSLHRRRNRRKHDVVRCQFICSHPDDISQSVRIRKAPLLVTGATIGTILVNRNPTVFTSYWLSSSFHNQEPPPIQYRMVYPAPTFFMNSVFKLSNPSFRLHRNNYQFIKEYIVLKEAYCIFGRTLSAPRGPLGDDNNQVIYKTRVTASLSHHHAGRHPRLHPPRCFPVHPNFTITQRSCPPSHAAKQIRIKSRHLLQN